MTIDRSSKGLRSLALILGLTGGLCAADSGTAQSQPPIHLLFDMHTDPLPQVALALKQVVYAEQLANANWVLDQVEPLGVQVSYLAVGEFMEMVTQEGASGAGAELLRRLYAAGGQVGSHSHSEYRRAANDWPSYPSTATFEQARRSWQDNISWVDSALLTALGSPPPQPLGEINAVKGAHLPGNETDYHELMRYFGLEVRQGGPEEDFFGIYDHFIMNPYRPATANPLTEDLAGAFVVSPQGSVIGLDQVHHGVRQNMTTANVKRLFIQVYLNWRYRDRLGLPARTWSFGWGSHTQDFAAGSASRQALVEVAQWLDQHFVGQSGASGSLIARWSTQLASAEEYFAWEGTHPGESSFDCNGTHLDWADYPYLRPVAEELWAAHHEADLDLGADITAWQLSRYGRRLVVAFSDAGPQLRDLSALLTLPCRIVGAESGLEQPCDPAAVWLDAEPLIVTTAAAGLLFADGFESGDRGSWSTATP